MSTTLKNAREVGVTDPLFGNNDLDKEKAAVRALNHVEEATSADSYSKKKQFLATMAATLGCFLNGTAIGYSGPANPSMMHPNSTDLYGNPMVVDFQNVSWISKYSNTWIELAPVFENT